MTEKQIQYIVHIHEKMERQGLGSDEETRKALGITGLDKHLKQIQIVFRLWVLYSTKVIIRSSN